MKHSWSTWLLLTPFALWFAVLLLVPLCVILVSSFAGTATGGGALPAFTLAQYASLPVRLIVFRTTITLAVLATALSLIIAYPLAYFIAMQARTRWRAPLLTLLVLPFGTSILIRTYAWTYLFGNHGIPALLNGPGWGIVRLINTPFAVLVGMLCGYLPLMVLPICLCLRRVDKQVLEAAADLGAPAWRRFQQVTLPLSFPGIATGCMLIFVRLLGEYLIPAMLGGDKVASIGNVLVATILQSGNRALGAAVFAALALILLTTGALYLWLMRRRFAASDDAVPP